MLTQQQRCQAKTPPSKADLNSDVLTENEFDAEDIKKIENYAKAINMLYCAVNPDDYRKISCCTTAKEMWDKLEVTYEGTDQVREAKIDFLTQEYEMFRMKEDKNRAGASGKSKAKSRAPTTSTEERLYYGDGSYLWFDSEEERTRFLTFFSKRVVAPPRIIRKRYPELQGYDDLDAQLHQAGLWPFLGRIAGLPYQGDDVSLYGGEDWVLNNEGLILNELGITELIRHASGCPTIHSANPEGHLLLYIVSQIIKPRKHGHTIMSGEDLKLIHAIMHSAPINWAKFVMINMTIAASTDHDHLLPYPFVVMDILEWFMVTTIVGPLTKATKIWAISTQTFKKRSDNAGPSIVVPRRRSAAGPAKPRPGPTLPPSPTPSTGFTSKLTRWMATLSGSTRLFNAKGTP
ncbi:unnamed protein product [Cuscuta campestris]|uniref:Uncharacterized protein n=1 Tax=Cuscuta campestris TaxID=132261 RepID=A0A484M3N3_9ASTE|nr:unnamed protein product [Cuscuta campestris]